MVFVRGFINNIQNNIFLGHAVFLIRKHSAMLVSENNFYMFALGFKLVKNRKNTRWISLCVLVGLLNTVPLEGSANNSLLFYILYLKFV